LHQQKQHQQDLQLKQQLDSQTLPQQHPLIQTEPQQHPLIQTEPQHKQLNQSPQQHSEHEPKNMEVGAVWTMANPKYKPGEPMLSKEALKLAGESC